MLEREPPDKGHKLIQAYTHRDEWLNGRMVLTPHAAFYAVESALEMRVKAARQMLNAAQGIPLRNCVNTEFLINSRVLVVK